MFDNIGGKIKRLATVLCWLGIIASVIVATTLWAQHDQYNYATRTRNDTFGAGAIVLVAGCVGSWIGSFFMYGFGELIDETSQTRKINAKILKMMENEEHQQRLKSQQQAAKQQRPVAVLPANPAPVSAKSTPWVCSVCGTDNDGNYPFCINCGESK